ncbi:arginase [Bordetella sp. 2513F-2]
MYRHPEDLPVTLIGAPTDAGAGVRGCSLGPGALRVAGIAAMLARRGLAYQDAGDLSGPPNPDLPRRHGYRNLDAVGAWCGIVHGAVQTALHEGRMPVVLGGDHSVSVGSLSAVAQHCRERGQALRVIWLDAHADFNTRELSPTGNLHGMPLACLCGDGPAALVRLSGRRPALWPAWVRQVGVRSIDPGEDGRIRQAGLAVYDMRDIDEQGMKAVMQMALAGVDAHTHLHVSFDVDFLDPAIAPGVGTPVPGGPSYREARLCMELLAETGRLRSLDIVELNPALDVRNSTAGTVVDLLGYLFAR